MAASALPTAHHEAVPPKIVSRPLVPVSAPAETPAEEAQPVMFASQVAKPTIRFASETEVAEALGSAAVPEAKAEPAPAPVAEAPVAAPPVAAEPVAETPPVQRPSYPVSSYYETARRQAWHELPRVDYTPHPAESAERVVPPVAEVVEEPQAVQTFETPSAPVPVVVEHIAPVVPHAESDTAKSSVFDDDFFRKPKEELVEGKAAEETATKSWPDARVPSFAGYAGEPAAESDELDIPAFLRRKQ